MPAGQWEGRRARGKLALPLLCGVLSHPLTWAVWSAQGPAREGGDEPTRPVASLLGVRADGVPWASRGTDRGAFSLPPTPTRLPSEEANSGVFGLAGDGPDRCFHLNSTFVELL